MKVFPTKFEAYKDGDCVFTVTAFDEGSAEVKIETVVNASSWDEIACEIKKCLLAMELEGDNNRSDT